MRVDMPRALSADLSPQLAPGWGTAREVLKVKSAFARPHLVELRWGRTTSLRFLRGGGARLSESANYALLLRLRSTEVGSKMWSQHSDEYAWHRSRFSSRYKFGLLRLRKPFAKQGEDICKRGHCLHCPPVAVVGVASCSSQGDTLVEWLLCCRPLRSDVFCGTGHMRLSGYRVAGLLVRMLFAIQAICG